MSIGEKMYADLVIEAYIENSLNELLKICRVRIYTIDCIFKVLNVLWGSQTISL